MDRQKTALLKSLDFFGHLRKSCLRHLSKVIRRSSAAKGSKRWYSLSHKVPSSKAYHAISDDTTAPRPDRPPTAQPCHTPAFWLYYWKYRSQSWEVHRSAPSRIIALALASAALPASKCLGRDADRDLIRSLARRLSEDTPEASELRATVSKSIAGDPPKPGGILAALRRSPLVNAELDLSRPREDGRKVDL